MRRRDSGRSRASRSRVPRFARSIFTVPASGRWRDVDLLVANSDMQAIAAAMGEIDYVEAFVTQRHRVFEPRRKVAPRTYGEHVDHPLKIEIDTAVAEPLPGA